jgi:hypothetical protein
MEIVAVKEQLRELHERLFPRLSDAHPHVFRKEWFTYEALVWARATFDARGFSLRFAPDEPAQSCLLPLVDLMNSADRPQTDGLGRYESSRGAYVVRAAARCPPARQVCLCYGAYANRERLLHYGYLTERNPYDYVLLYLEPPDEGEGESEVLRERRLSLLSRLGLQLENYVRAGGVAAGRLLGALRVLLASPDELAALEALTPLSRPWHPTHPARRPLSPRTERAALLALRQALSGLLGEILAALEEEDQGDGEPFGADEEEPPEEQEDELPGGGDASAAASDGWRLATRYREMRKELLEDALRDVDERLRALPPPAT